MKNSTTQRIESITLSRAAVIAAREALEAAIHASLKINGTK